MFFPNKRYCGTRLRPRVCLPHTLCHPVAAFFVASLACHISTILTGPPSHPCVILFGTLFQRNHKPEEKLNSLASHLLFREADYPGSAFSASFCQFDSDLIQEETRQGQDGWERGSVAECSLSW